MAKAENTKARVAALWQIFEQHSDKRRGLTMDEILKRLEADYYITATRQTVTDDFYLMESVLGITIETVNNTRPAKYYWTNRPFEPEDIEALADGIQMNPMVSDKKRNEILRKLKGLISEVESRRLGFRTITEDKFPMSPETEEKIELLRQAISEKKPVYFSYWTHLWSQTTALIENEEVGVDAIPCEVSFEQGKPYLYAYWRPSKYRYRSKGDAVEELNEGHVWRFSICGLSGLTVKEFGFKEEPQPELAEMLEQFDPERNRIAGNVKSKITLKCSRIVLEDIKSRFGDNIQIEVIKPTQKFSCRLEGMMYYEGMVYLVTTETIVSPELFGWIFGLGNEIEITGPDPIRRRMQRWVKSAAARYGIES